MNFNSLRYIVFFAVNVLVYYLLPGRWRNIQLLAASYFFYMCWNPAYALLLLFSTLVTYCCGLLTADCAWGRRKLWMALALVLNLSLLFFFKYFNFVSELIGRGASLLGWLGSAPRVDVLLPVGISFYVFQALGYTIDVYRKDVEAERNFINYALFVSFFPQLVAGPIERSGHMLTQFREYHLFRWDNLREGILPVLWGLFKKMVLADNLAVIVNTVYRAPQNYFGSELAVATAAFAVQIYCDFSAYSDIARGSAKMLGFHLMENFRLPYLAASIQEFWRRWHISLSSWFKDYLYIPLGGSRCSKFRRWINVMIVFAISGLWHGAALTFVAWGLLNGLYQVASGLLEPLREKWFSLTGINREAGWLHIFRKIFTFLLICLAWVLFRVNSLSDAAYIFQALFTFPWNGTWDGLGVSSAVAVMLTVFTVVLFAVDWMNIYQDLPTKLNRSIFPRYAVYFLLIACILVFGSYGEGYDPQAFVYFQF